MLNRISLDPISESDRIQPYYDTRIIEKEDFFDERVIYPISDRYVNPYIDIIRPPALPINLKAQYRFVDAATGRLIYNVQITSGLHGLGYSVNASTGIGSFSSSEANKTYTVRANGYNSQSFRPIAGRTITVLMKKAAVKTAQYKFVDAANGRVITGVRLSTQTNITDRVINDFLDPRDIQIEGRLLGLGSPTYANGVYTFPSSDFNSRYNIAAPGYNASSIIVTDHTGVTTVRLIQQKATVKFIDASTRQPIRGVTVHTGLSSLLGLGTTYTNRNGVFTFSFNANEYVQNYTISAPGYISKKITAMPSTVLKTVKLEKERVFIKQPDVKTGNDDTARRLRLAKAKAKARIRKIKLLAI